MLKTFMFDLGNVLVHFSHDQMYRQMGALCGLSGPELRGMFDESRILHCFETGQLNESGFHIAFQNLVGREVDFERLRLAGADIFTLHEAMVPLLSQLRANGFRLVMLSNTCISHFEHIQEQFPLLDQFDAHVLSYRTGCCKPETAIFDAAWRVIDCEPEECFFTDDLPENVAAARAYGFDAEVFIDARSFVENCRDRGLLLNLAESA